MEPYPYDGKFWAPQIFELTAEELLFNRDRSTTPERDSRRYGVLQYVIEGLRSEGLDLRVGLDIRDAVYRAADELERLDCPNEITQMLDSLYTDIKKMATHQTAQNNYSCSQELRS